MLKCNKIKTVINLFFSVFLIVATLFMCIGYASINSISLEMDGELVAQAQDGIFITEANYSGNVSADLSSSQVISAYQTNLNSRVVLSETDPNSSITYEIIIYNSTGSDYSFVSADYVLDNNIYDNENIIFSHAGLEPGDLLASGQSVRFLLKFYYKNNVVPDDNQLNSVINFVFEPVNVSSSSSTLINDGGDWDLVFGHQFPKSDIEAIYTVDNVNVPSGATSWDASTASDGSIIAWTVDSDGNSMYELYLGSENGKILLPSDSSYLFTSFDGITRMDLSNLDTSQVTNMSYMFYGLYGISYLDLSSFNTSNVTNMEGMFHYSVSFASLDLSSFDTSNVTNMNYLFAYAYNLTSIKLNNATFESVVNSDYMFDMVPSDVYVVTKDDTTRSWLQGKLGSGNGTVVTVAELS